MAKRKAIKASDDSGEPSSSLTPEANPAGADDIAAVADAINLSVAETGWRVRRRKPFTITHNGRIAGSVEQVTVSGRPADISKVAQVLSRARAGLVPALKTGANTRIKVTFEWEAKADLGEAQQPISMAVRTMLARDPAAAEWCPTTDLRVIDEHFDEAGELMQRLAKAGVIVTTIVLSIVRFVPLAIA
jgi:hypothetical protein